MSSSVIVVANGIIPVADAAAAAPCSSASASSAAGRVPCVCVCVPGAKCPRDVSAASASASASASSNGERSEPEHCTFSHKTPCLYSTDCHNLAEDHRLRFYHPQGACIGASNSGPSPLAQGGAGGGSPSSCGRTDINHWRSMAHPCAIRGCPKPTVAMLNGWVCGYHYKLMTDFYRKK